MPSYIGFTPQFNPLSLQEVLAVPTMILGEYAKAEDEFGNYQDKAAQLEAMVGEDPYGKAIINNYRNQLQNTANTIGDKGIQNAEGLRQALGVRRYYRENLMPLEVGIPYWEQYKKAKLALGEDPLEDPLTLESFIKNPAQAYSLTKGSDVRNLAANMAKAASARRIKDPEYIGRVLEGTHYRTKSEAGFSDQEVQDWINGVPNPELDEIRNEVQKQYGNISPEKLNRFINEGIYLGAIYDKKFEDKAVPKVSTSGSGTGTGNDSNVKTWEDLVNSLISGDGINVVDRNLFRPTTATNANGNLIESVSDDGTVIIKSPMKIVGSLYSPIGNNNSIVDNIDDMTNIISNVKDDNLKNKWLGELNKLSEQSGIGNSRPKKLESNRAAYDNIAKEVIQHVFLHKNTDGTYSLNYNKSTDGNIDLAPFKNKLKGSLFAGTRGNMKDIIQQLESAGITNKDKFKDVNDFIATLDNAYNRSGSFRNKGMTTAFDFQYSEDEKDRKLENIQGDWRVMDDTSFEKGSLQYSTKPFSLDDKTKLFQRRKDGKVSYKHEFNVVETPEGPKNFHAVHVEDRVDNKHYTLVFTPDQWNGYRTNAESMASYNNDVQKMQIYLHGTPQQLKQIGSSLLMSIDDINRNIQRCSENNDVKNARLWEILKQEYYRIMIQEGVPQNIAETNRALKASALEGSTVIGKYNKNSEKADRNAN